MWRERPVLWGRSLCLCGMIFWTGLVCLRNQAACCSVLVAVRSKARTLILISDWQRSVNRRRISLLSCQTLRLIRFLFATFGPNLHWSGPYIFPVCVDVRPRRLRSFWSRSLRRCRRFRGRGCWLRVIRRRFWELWARQVPNIPSPTISTCPYH